MTTRTKTRTMKSSPASRKKSPPPSSSESEMIPPMPPPKEDVTCSEWISAFYDNTSVTSKSRKVAHRVSLSWPPGAPSGASNTKKEEKEQQQQQQKRRRRSAPPKISSLQKKSVVEAAQAAGLLVAGPAGAGCCSSSSESSSSKKKTQDVPVAHHLDDDPTTVDNDLFGPVGEDTGLFSFENMNFYSVDEDKVIVDPQQPEERLVMTPLLEGISGVVQQNSQTNSLGKVLEDLHLDILQRKSRLRQMAELCDMPTIFQEWKKKEIDELVDGDDNSSSTTNMDPSSATSVDDVATSQEETPSISMLKESDQRCKTLKYNRNNKKRPACASSWQQVTYEQQRHRMPPGGGWI